MAELAMPAWDRLPGDLVHNVCEYLHAFEVLDLQLVSHGMHNAVDTGTLWAALWTRLPRSPSCTRALVPQRRRHPLFEPRVLQPLLSALAVAALVTSAWYAGDAAGLWTGGVTSDDPGASPSSHSAQARGWLMRFTYGVLALFLAAASMRVLSPPPSTWRSSVAGSGMRRWALGARERLMDLGFSTLEQGGLRLLTAGVGITKLWKPLNAGNAEGSRDRGGDGGGGGSGSGGGGGGDDDDDDGGDAATSLLAGGSLKARAVRALRLRKLALAHARDGVWNEHHMEINGEVIGINHRHLAVHCRGRAPVFNLFSSATSVLEYVLPADGRVADRVCSAQFFCVAYADQPGVSYWSLESRESVFYKRQFFLIDAHVSSLRMLSETVVLAIDTTGGVSVWDLKKPVDSKTPTADEAKEENKTFTTSRARQRQSRVARGQLPAAVRGRNTSRSSAQLAQLLARAQLDFRVAGHCLDHRWAGRREFTFTKDGGHTRRGFAKVGDERWTLYFVATQREAFSAGNVSVWKLSLPRWRVDDWYRAARENQPGTASASLLPFPREDAVQLCSLPGVQSEPVSFAQLQLGAGGGDEHWLLTASRLSHNITLWNTRAGQRVRTIQLNSAPIACLRWTSGRVLTSDDRGHVVLWELGSGAKRATTTETLPKRQKSPRRTATRRSEGLWKVNVLWELETGNSGLRGDVVFDDLGIVGRCGHGLRYIDFVGGVDTKDTGHDRRKAPRCCGLRCRGNAPPAATRGSRSHVEERTVDDRGGIPHGTVPPTRPLYNSSLKWVTRGDDEWATHARSDRTRASRWPSVGVPAGMHFSVFDALDEERMTPLWTRMLKPTGKATQ